MNTTRPADEHALAPDQVGERAGGQQERGERQRVGVDDPLQVLEATSAASAGCRAARRSRR